MKAEMAVRSISASISACAARMAPRTISRVTASQALGTEFLASVERGIRSILHEGKRECADDRGKDQEERGRYRVAGLRDQIGRDERCAAAEQGDRHAVADRQS